MKNKIFEKIFLRIEELLLVTDCNFVCKYATSHFLNYFDIKKSNVINHNILEFLPEEYNEDLLNEILSELKYISSKLNFSSSLHQFSIRMELISSDDEKMVLFHIYKPNIVKDEQLKFLSQATIDLMSMTNPNEIYKYIAEKIYEITDNCYVTALKYDKETDRMEVIHIEGLSNKSQLIFKILGRDPVGMQFPIHKEGKKLFSSGNLMRGPDDLSALTSNWLPQIISKKITDFFNIERIYLIGISNNRNNYSGEIIIFQKNDGQVTYPSLIETFVKNAGVILEKKIAEQNFLESENRYQTVFNGSNTINLIIEPETKKIVDANKSAEKFYGYSKEEFKELYVFDLNINTIDIIEKDIQDSINKRKKFFTFRHRTKSGTIKDVEVNTSLIELSGKKYILSHIKDITELLNNKYRLERGEAITNIGNWEIDVNTKKVYASDGARKIYGIKESDLSISTIKKIQLPEYEEYLDKTLQNLIDNNESYDIKFKIKSADTGKIKHIRSIAHFNKTKNIVYGAIQDISELVEIENQLIKAKEAAEERDKLKSSFLANLSHEIRTPMNAIKGFAEILKEPDLTNEEMNDYIDIIDENADQLLSIINDVLDISKIESGIIDFTFEHIHLNSFCKSMSRSYELRCENKGLKFNLFTDKKDSYIYADKSRIKQICDNIFGNALKFTQSGSITIGFENHNGEIMLFIEDTGIGIPKDKQDKVFERFYQIEENYFGKNDGTGLGLAITQSLIEKMNAEIKLESEVNKGSRFEIRFKKAPDIQIADTATNLVHLNTKNLENKNILVAEDYPANFELIKAILKKYEVNTDWAKNGEEAFKMSKIKDYDLILMDIKMPVMDGITSAAIIKTYKPNIPIIAQTAYAMNGDKKIIENSECDDVIIKPVNHTELIQKILKYI